MSTSSAPLLAASEALIQQLPCALLVLDAQRKICLANRAAERLFEYQSCELLDRPLSVLIPDGARSRPPGDELTAYKKGGAPMLVELTLTETATTAGPNTLATVIDVSERKRLDNELRRKDQDMERLLYVVSHDLREPMRIVSSFLGLLAQKYQGKLEADAERYIHFAVDGATRMHKRLDGLLAYSRVRAPKSGFIAVDCAVTLRAALLNLKRVIEDSRAQIEADQLPIVEGDPELLQQLFAIIIHNALKFRSAAPPRLSISATTQAGTATIQFKDNGTGFDISQSHRVFELFQRLHDAAQYEGTGVGLAIAKRIVELHAGTIRIEAAPEAGCRVFVSLPLARQTPDAHG